jgi:hypothetical protein
MIGVVGLWPEYMTYDKAVAFVQVPLVSELDAAFFHPMHIAIPLADAVRVVEFHPAGTVGTVSPEVLTA